MTWKKQTTIMMLSAAFAAALLVGCGGQTPAAAPTDIADGEDGGMAAAAALIADIPTNQAFTDDAVAEEDIDKILSAGINAPSAMNGQNWHFTAVADADVLQQISGDMSGGQPAAVPPVGGTAQQPERMVPADDSFAGQADGNGEQSSAPLASNSGGPAKAGITDAPLAIIVSCKEGSEFDAGLACQNMSAEAQLLGYGTKIIASPTIALNGENQQTYREMLDIPDDQSAIAVLLVGMEDTSLDADAITAATTRNSEEELVTRNTP